MKYINTTFGVCVCVWH